MRARRTAGFAMALAMAVALGGCFNPFSPKIASTFGVAQIAPTPNSPRGVTDLFAWCWNNRAYDEYTEIFTEDFEFHFAETDSAGNAFRNRALYRDDELETARHLFIEGTGSEPPATKIVLTFDRTFAPGPVVTIPGKTYPFHQEVKRNVVLTIDVGEQAYRITGAARFFVVRGDSAVIPDDLIQRGFGPDPNRWYIERWEDETLDTASGLIANLDPEAYRAAMMAALAAERASTPATPASATGFIGEQGVTWGWMKARFY